MKATLAVFLLALLFSTLAAAQNPYPTSCDNFSTETAYCSDVHPGAGCHGSLAGIIVASTGADGTSFAQPGTLSCTGGTVNCPGTNSPTCPTCPSVSGYYVEATNPDCGSGIGGGGGCNVTSPLPSAPTQEEAKLGSAKATSPTPPPPQLCGPGTCCTPILVDTSGRGFQLTSAEAGVMFDFWGNGHPVKLSWTAAGSGNAFLACLDCWKDIPDNGKIDSAKKLFGNLTEQPKSDHPNGYLALAEFDKPENGGNGDGIIDSRDAVYSKLLLWIDENHDGISQPNELHTLPELGVYSISLKYHQEPFVDQYGNQFRYRGVLNPDAADGTSKDGRYTYDVFFVSDKTAAAVTGPARPKTFATDQFNRMQRVISAADHNLN